MVTLERSARMAEYYQMHKDQFAHYAARGRDRLKLEMIFAYGEKCRHCGNDDPEVLMLDHIDDDAWIEKEEFGLNARGGHKHYARLKKQGWPQERFQLLCFNCNAIKEHKRRRAFMEQMRGEFEYADHSLAHAAEGLRSNNSSGIKGVYWNTGKRAWQAKITFKGDAIHCGFFSDIREAARAYAVRARELWGSNAKIASEEEIQAAYELQTNGYKTELSIDQLGL